MKRTFLFALLATVAVTTAQAQQNKGSLTVDQVQRMAGALTPANKAIFNAMASNKIDDLAQNFDNLGPVDTHFSIETPSQSIHDQKSSGRCWMFSGLNVLRANFAKQHNDTLAVEFSHDYLFFYDQLEKANLMLQGAIETARLPMNDPKVQFFFKSPINDGGTFCGVADLAEKYGLVPMSIQRETFSANNTSKMAQILKSKLREFGIELRQMVNGKKKAADIEKRKQEQLTEVYRILALTLGEPVKSFTYAFADSKGKQKTEPKQYTPLEFYKATVGAPINGTFVMVMNDPRNPYHKTYEVEYDRHTYDGHNWRYLNLPMDEIEQLAVASLKDGRKLYSSYDVGKQLDRKRGYLDLGNFDYESLFDTSFNMDKAQRIATFDSGSTHAMTLTAVDLDANGKPVKWKVENSWGAANGFAGCFIMTDRWFREYMFRLVVDRKYVPENLLKEYEQQPVMLTPEDPLFASED